MHSFNCICSAKLYTNLGYQMSYADFSPVTRRCRTRKLPQIGHSITRGDKLVGCHPVLNTGRKELNISKQEKVSCEECGAPMNPSLASYEHNSLLLMYECEKCLNFNFVKEEYDQQ